jgi:GNAT superfamily N-acetyltransferase
MIQIRPFADSDAANLAAFMVHWRALPILPDPEEILQQIRHCKERVSGDLFLAMDTQDGREVLVGYLQMCEISLVCFPPSAELSAILVHEELRGRGIGRQLVKQAVEWTREKGLSRLLVSSQLHLEKAHRFYEREGFTRWKSSAFFTLGV